MSYNSVRKHHCSSSKVSENTIGSIHNGRKAIMECSATSIGLLAKTSKYVCDNTLTRMESDLPLPMHEIDGIGHRCFKSGTIPKN